VASVSGPRPIVPPPTDPHQVARQFMAEHYTDEDGARLLRYWRGDWHAWTGTHWPEVEDRQVKSDLWTWLADADYVKPATATKPSEQLPFEPTKYKVANVLDALQACSHLSASVAAPAWLAEAKTAATEMVAMSNGLLHLPTRILMPHTPSFFTHHALPFEFDPAAPRPRRWLQFLDELWSDDPEAISTLAEVFGYILSGETRQQKMFMLVGPKRGGKGTIARVLTGLLGAHNVAAPTLSGLTSNFGLSPLIGKPLAVVSDARLGSRSDSLIAVERLLSVSGEDSITVDRKYRDPWTGQLPSRFVILTNELPRLTDSSGALASRFIMLLLTQSFYGREDPRLTDELLREAPGIFNWALEGLDRLEQRGAFEQPPSSQAAIQQLADLASPVSSFLRDRCEIGTACEVEKDELYAAWKQWCEEEGRGPGTKAIFVRDLRAAVPGLTPRKLRAEDKRVHVLQGVRLAEQCETSLTTPDQESPGRDGQGSSALYLHPARATDLERARRFDEMYPRR
jgi:putative DNA primase/helicase